MKLLGNRVLISPLPKEEKEGFQTVEVQDSFVYKGKVEMVGQIEPTLATGYRVSEDIKVGDILIFAKYSPDTHEYEHEGKKYKSVLISDVIAVL